MYLNCVGSYSGGLAEAVPTTGWLWFLAGHTVLVPLLVLEARAVLFPFPLFLWLQAQQTSSCGLYCAFYSFPLRLVTQQHFHPCEQRRMVQAHNWVSVYYHVLVSIILYLPI